MRNRLIELLKDVEWRYLEISKMFPYEKSLTDFTVDYLLENGVIVPPCKVRDEVYFICFDKIYPHKIKYFEINRWGRFACSSTQFPFECFGKTVFLTREEAEQALKGGVE